MLRIINKKALNIGLTEEDFRVNREAGVPHKLGILNALETQSLQLASYMEAQAEINRINGASGIFSVRQYNVPKPFDTKTKVWDTGYSSLNIHNHSNYRGMPGTAEFSAMVNGYYVRTRHNDYRSFSPTGLNFARKEIMPPVPTDNTTKYMRDLYTSNPEDCVFYLSYIEVWLEKFNESDIGDRTDSFRHVTEAKDMRDALDKAILFNASGHKNRRENLPYQPILIRRVNENGVSELAVVRYRISVYPVASLAPTGMNKEFTYSDNTTFTTRLVGNPNFKVRKGVGAKEFFDTDKLAEMCALCPGLDGPSANIVESYSDPLIRLDDTITDIGTTNVKNAAFYNHSFSFVGKDASGRSNAQRSFNDPNLFVAKTENDLVIDGISYMIPFELILRTPRESWNPDALPVIPTSDITGTGTKDDPYNGVNPQIYNFTIPFSLFNIEPPESDPASTENLAWVNNKLYYASGINIIGYDGIRIRYPVAPCYHDYSKAASDLSIYKESII